ncbi:MAG: hypothetical protein K9K86_07205 [Pseudomonadales bacterium]|nr:hypothetical protein [Pseudomonadales bacterium]
MPASIGSEELSINERTLRTLSFCEPTPRHMEEWVKNLPMVNLGEASRQLYHAIIELNQLIIEPDIRIKLLELLRTPIQYICKSLSKHYLNQPVILPEKARKVARLAMALDNHLAIGYKIVVHDNAKVDHSLLARKSRKTSTIAIHRAISSLSKVIVRSCELYIHAPEKTWQELHKLYLIAESNKVQDAIVEDKDNVFLVKSTIADAYKRAIMLGCCNPNQVRQSDIKCIYEITEIWSKKVQITPVNNNSSFVVNLGSDAPPIHRDLARKKMNLFYRAIDLTPLVQMLKEYLSQSEGIHDAFVKGITVPKSIPEDLVRYLVKVWSSLTERSFSRAESNKQIQLSIGFSSAHFFVSGGVDFDTQLQRGSKAKTKPKHEAFIAQDRKPKYQQNDAWAGGYDVGREELPIDPQRHLAAVNYSIIKDQEVVKPDEDEILISSPKTPTQYSAKLIDTSPNGYRIKWESMVPKEIKTGEMVAINEGISHTWSIGVIRWINNQQSPAEAQMGVELIAPGAIPCGAKVVTKSKRRSDYMRALLLPSTHTPGRSATIFTPNLPFKSGVKIIVNQYGEVSHGLLGERISNTGSFSQFVYHPDTGVDVRDESDDNIEDLWPDI